jgi:hypothetical protein
MKKITILLLAIAAVASGCKKFTNINNNPNQPTVVTPNVVLSAALVGSASDLANDFQNTARWMGYWSRSGSYIEDIPTETYVLQTTYADGDFQSLYSVLTRYNYIEHNSNGDPFYVGVAKTMKALHFSTLVNGFGNVPYSQAFNLSKYPTPIYDDQKAIYLDLIAQCDSAVTYFQQAITYYSTAPATIIKTDDQYDVMYGRGAGVNPTTRVNEWIAFCNTVKLKLLVTGQNSSSISSITSAEIAKITANGQGFIGPNQSASVNPGYSSSANSKENPFYGDFYLTSGATNNDYAYYRANSYYITYGSLNSDSRYTDDYAQVSGAWVGNYDGDPLALPNSNTSGLGSGTYGNLHSAAQDEFIISDFESLFIQAEATFEKILPGGTAAAATLAAEGTEQSYVWVDDYGDGVAADNVMDADTYLLNITSAQSPTPGSGNPLTDVSPANITLQSIMTLKWSALNSVNWEEAYSDYRRTGYPYPDGNNFGFSHANNVFKHSSPDVKGVVQPINLPYRYLYPQSELNTNGKNVPAGITAYTPVFWDTREK